jgi:hypothetical protein
MAPANNLAKATVSRFAERALFGASCAASFPRVEADEALSSAVLPAPSMTGMRSESIGSAWTAAPAPISRHAKMISQPFRHQPR